MRAVGGAGQRDRHGDRHRPPPVLDRPRTATSLADVPAAALEEDEPLYDRPRRPSDRPRRSSRTTRPTAATDAGRRPVHAARRPVLGVPPVRPSAVPQHGRRRRAATPPSCASRPPGFRRPDGRSPSPPTATPAGARSTPGPGAALTVAEACLNVACAGARPVALVNCLNFGNPEHPEVMWQLSEAIDGMAEACRALDLPVIGGNVSLYNESRGADIDPTPDRRRARPHRPPRAGARPGRARRRGRRSCCSARPSRTSAARGGRPSATATGAAACRPSTSPPTHASCQLVAGLVADDARRTASTTSATAASGWPSPRWRSQRRSGSA